MQAIRTVVGADRGGQPGAEQIQWDSVGRGIQLRMAEGPYNEIYLWEGVANFQRFVDPALNRFFIAILEGPDFLLDAVQIVAQVESVAVLNEVRAKLLRLGMPDADPDALKYFSHA
ncbi:hypothetical protein D9M69_692700 [compost metagenome]